MILLDTSAPPCGVICGSERACHLFARIQLQHAAYSMHSSSCLCNLFLCCSCVSLYVSSLLPSSLFVSCPRPSIVVSRLFLAVAQRARKDHDAVSCFNPEVTVHDCKLRVDGISKYLDSVGFRFDHAFGEDVPNQLVKIICCCRCYWCCCCCCRCWLVLTVV